MRSELNTQFNGQSLIPEIANAQDIGVEAARVKGVLEAHFGTGYSAELTTNPSQGL